MRVLFLTAPELKRRSIDAIFPPAAALYLAGFLRERGHEVDPIDLDARVLADPELFQGLVRHPAVGDLDAWTRVVDDLDAAGVADLAERLLEPVVDRGYDLVAISARRPEGALLLARLVATRVRAPIVVGGDVEVEPGDFLRRAPSVRFLARGHGEGVLPDLLEHLGGTRAAEQCRSLVLPREGEAFLTPSQGAPFPERALPDPRGHDVDPYLLLPTNFHQVPNPGGRLLLPLQFIHGCPFRCSFCRVPTGTHEGKPFHAEEPARVVDALERYAALGVRDVAFFNNTLCVGMGYLRRFCDEIVRRGLKLRWSDSGSFNGIEPEALPMLREAGCVALTFGLESASPRILDKMNRRYSVERASRLLRAAHDAGIWLQANVIVGFPGETAVEYDETARFVEEHADAIDAIAISPFYLTDSAIARSPEAYGVRLRDDRSGLASRHRSTSLAFDELDGDHLAYEARFDEAARREHDLYQRYFKAHGGVRPANDLLEVHDLFTYNDGAAAIHQRLAARDLRFVLNLGAACRNACRGCPFANERAAAARPRTLADLAAALKVAKEAGYARVLLTGGEPTLRADLADVVRAAATLHYAEIVLETDGAGLTTPEGATRLREAGLTSALLKLEGGDEATHDASVGRAGAFQGLLSARRLLREAGLPTARALPLWMGAMSPCLSRKAYATLREARVRYPWET